MKLQANAGEMIYDFLSRALYTAYESNCTLEACHNDVIIIIYPDSVINDICDKFDMQRVINKLKGN
jgi:(2Fe-2S) ferredoxin